MTQAQTGYLKKLFLILAVMAGGVTVSLGQIIVAGTDFTATSGKQSEYYIAADNIDQYGVSAATLTPGPPWHTGLLTTFNNRFQYLIINNPVKIDSTKFLDRTPDYMFVVSPPTSSNLRILDYIVSDMEPGSNATVKISFCSVVDPAKSTSSNPTFNCVGQQAGFKMVIGQQNDQNKIDKDFQVPMGACTTITETFKVDASGQVPVHLLTSRTGSQCLALGISKIEVEGKIVAEGLSEQGQEVCAGEQITLRPKVPYNGSFKWQVNEGGTWKDLGTGSAQNYETKGVGDYTFRYLLTPVGSSSVVTSKDIKITAIKCCEAPNGAASSRQTIYYDDFGTLDMSDATGRTYKVWDYTSDPTNPKQVTKTTSTPFRWPVSIDPPGTFIGAQGKPLVDGEYAVAAYITGYSAYRGIDGAMLQWASQVTGPIAQPPINYDHSGTVEGGALFINNPFNSSGSVIYKRNITNLCTTNGKTIYFECYITVFTTSDNGVDVSVRLTGGGAPVVLNARACKAGGGCPGAGNWVRISGQVTLAGNSLLMEVINNAPNSWNEKGNDLVIDDIKIMACAPPSIDLVFDKTTLSKSENVCKKASMFATPTENFKKYYNDSPFYLYQWTLTPNDNASWKNLTGPVQDESYLQNDPKTLVSPELTNGKKVYFRLISGLQSTFADKNNFQGTGNYANMNDPCRNYSVSTPIEATIDCPACVTPTSLTVKNGATTVIDNGTIEICDSTQLSLDLAGVWPTPPAELEDKNFEFYVISKATGTEIWKSTPVAGGTNGSRAYTVPANLVKPNLTGAYTIGVRNTTSCKLEQTINIKVNEKPRALIIDSTVICQGSKRTLTVKNPVTGATYAWTLAGTGATPVTGTGQTFEITAGSADMTATVQLTANNCTGPVKRTVIPVDRKQDSAKVAKDSLKFCPADGIPNLNAIPVSVGKGTWTVASSTPSNPAVVIASPNVNNSSFTVQPGQQFVANWTTTSTLEKCPPMTASVVVMAASIDKPSVMLTTPKPIICKGNKAKFYISPGLGGNAPAYKVYSKSGLLTEGTNYTKLGRDSFEVVVNSDLEDYYVEMTSSSNCADPKTAVSEKITVKMDAIPTTANILTPDKIICTDTIYLKTSPVTTGTGTWSKEPGVTASVDAATGFVSGLEVNTDNVFIFTVKSPLGVCPSTDDRVKITRAGSISPATISLNGTVIRGSDTALCVGRNYTILPSNINPNPALGERGRWNIISGTSVSFDTTVKSSQPLVLNSTGNTTVTWTISATTGCPPVVKEVTFKVGDPPQLDPIIVSPICEDATGTYTVPLKSGAGVNTLPVLNYVWKGRAVPGATGTATLQGSPSGNTADFVFTSAATTGATDKAAIWVQAENACGLSDSVRQEILINLKPRDFSGGITGIDSICESATSTQTYTVQPQSNTTAYIWTLNGDPVPAGAQPALQVTIDDTELAQKFPTAEIRVTLQNACGTGVDTVKKTKIIEAIPVKAVLVGPEKVCLPLDPGVYTGSTPNGGTGATFEFAIRRNGEVQRTQPYSPVNTFNTTPGELMDKDVIELKVTGDPATGCFTPGDSDPATLVIDGYGLPDPRIFKNDSLQPDSICSGSVISLCAREQKGAPIEYKWFKDNVLVPGVNTACIDLGHSSQSGLYRVRVDNNVCPPDSSLDRRVRIYDRPEVEISPSRTTIELAVTPRAELHGVVSNLFTDTLTYLQWTGPYMDSTDNPLKKIVTPPAKGGDFYYTLTVATGEGRAFPCEARAEAHVKALPPVRIPNAFTPNGDGLNDTWHIEGIETYPNAKVYLFNRWGERLFKSSPYGPGNEWDGRTNGSEVPAGTYYFIIELNEDLRSQKAKIDGHLTVIR